MDIRRKRAADSFGLGAGDRTRLKNMVRGEFFVQGPAFGSNTILLSIPDTRTHKPAVGLGYVAPPPPPDAIKEILKNFAALPEEAATEAATLAQANRLIADLRQRVRQGQGPSAEIVTREIRVEVLVEVPVERIVEVEKIREVPVFAAGEIERFRQMADDMAALGKDLLAESSAMRVRLKPLLTPAGKESKVQAMMQAPLPPLPPLPPLSEQKPTPKIKTETRAKPEDVPEPAGSSPAASVSAVSALTALTAPQQRILDAIATFASLGIFAPPRANVAAWSGASGKSGAYANNLGALRSAGLITYLSSSAVRLTADGEGRAKTGPRPLPRRALLRAWTERVSSPQGRLLKYLWERGGTAVSRQEPARATGASPTSGAYANNLGALRMLGLILYPDTSSAAATDLLLASGLPLE